MKKRHVDYVEKYAENLTPVIPHDATLVAKSKIAPGNRGKVPGRRNAEGHWYGGWLRMGAATLERAKIWDGWLAHIGFRTGFASVFAIDIDLTVREDAERVLAIAMQMFGKRLAVRRVDHPDHTKLLICLRFEGELPRSFNADVIQSNGKVGGIQFLGPGRYFNVHGIHPRRLAPYVWVNDPADVDLVTVNKSEFEGFWVLLAHEFQLVRRVRTYAPNESQREPETCTAEELEALLDLIPNDETFDDYLTFVTMGAAIYGASAGAPWGRAMWLAWCDQAGQEQPEKPEIFWDSMRKARVGVGMLRKWASERQPVVMAQRAFNDPPIEEVIEPEQVEQIQAEEAARAAFLEGWVLVGGAHFYSLRRPRNAIKPDAFNRMHVQEMNNGLRFALGGGKKSTAAGLFALKSPNQVMGIVHQPGQPRFVVEQGEQFLNMWTPPARPHLGQPIDFKLVDRYRDLAEFVLGSAEEADLWIKWHAWMLQNPGRPPGWQWIVQTDPGKGKDLILLPIGLAHGDDYTPVNPTDLTDRFNDYASKHLIATSEMKERGRTDAYLKLKAITSGQPTISIRPAYAPRCLATNVAGFIIFSNEERPFRIDHNDRRLHVVANFDQSARSPEYYSETKRLFLEHWAILGEALHLLPLSADDNAMMAGNAPPSSSKHDMAEEVAERTLREIMVDLESDHPPIEYFPVATATQIVQWLEAEKIRAADIPNRLEMPSLLYRLGARPVSPDHKNPKRANGVEGKRLWRLVNTFRTKGVRWNLETMGPKRLAQLHAGGFVPEMTPDDLKVEEGEL